MVMPLEPAFENFTEIFAVVPADVDPLIVLEDEDGFAVEIGLDFLDGSHVDDERSVRADEHAGVQFFLEVAQRLVEKVFPRFGMEGGIAPGRLDPERLPPLKSRSPVWTGREIF